MSFDLHPVFRKAEVLLLELARLDQEGPSFIIIHDYRLRGTVCQAGEEVSRVILIQRGRRVVLPLQLALRLVFDYLARHRHTPQNATQISAGIRASDFCRFHGLNSGLLSARKISRSAVKEYVSRIRKALAIAFYEAALPLDPLRVIVSEATVGNETRYNLRGKVEWLHCKEIAERHSRSK
jgi:hypothetical protein